MCQSCEHNSRQSAGKNGIAATFLLGVIRVYQLTLSSVMGRQCRFLPTCSEYTGDAIRQHGAWAGFWLGFSRVLSCHPWGGNGYDPVPAKPNKPVWMFWRHTHKDLSEDQSGSLS